MVLGMLVVVKKLKIWLTPAQLTRTSSWPHSDTTLSTACFRLSSEEMSHSMFKIFFGAESVCGRMSREATFAPLDRKSETIAAPMPLLPPVTSTTWWGTSDTLRAMHDAWTGVGGNNVFAFL